MPESTYFRKTMVEQLEEMVYPEKLAKFQEENPYADAKDEMICHWVNYYDDDLLAYPPFSAEFSRGELGEIAKVTRRFGKLTPKNWDQIRLEAKHLLGILRKSKGHSLKGLK